MFSWWKRADMSFKTSMQSADRVNTSDGIQRVRTGSGEPVLGVS